MPSLTAAFSQFFKHLTFLLFVCCTAHFDSCHVMHPLISPVARASTRTDFLQREVAPPRARGSSGGRSRGSEEGCWLRWTSTDPSEVGATGMVATVMYFKWRTRGWIFWHQKMANIEAVNWSRHRRKKMGNLANWAEGSHIILIIFTTGGHRFVILWRAEIWRNQK